jgi:hypothetical protein
MIEYQTPKRYLAISLTALTAGLAACDDSNTQVSSVDPTIPLVVSVGEDIQTTEREVVQLSANLSGSTNGTTPTWTQLSGPVVDVEDPTLLSTRFVAPNVRNDESVVLRLSVTNLLGQQSSDDITITVQNLTNGPNGPSPQGIPNNGNDRRDRARNNRENSMMLDNREVRTYDGSNNNTANPNWGASFIHLQRLAPSAYADGIDDLAGPNRPSARIISNAVINQDEGTSLPNLASGTDFVWQWGQFIDHDIDLTDGAEEAANIAVPTGDIFFDPESTGLAEIPLNRALFDPDTGFTTTDPREQENEITSWIDGSMVYGSGDDRAEALRVASDSPLLKTSAGNLLPFNEDSLTNANGFVTDPTQLFLAGDIRANEQLALATLHTLFVREHNRIAAILENDFPTNSADEIFEATRRLVVAKIQKITFDEWLPALVGETAIPDYSGYDNTINPSIFNEFSAAAFRLGHSMINEQLLRLDESGAEIAAGNIELARAFFTAPSILIDENSLDPILRGLATQTHQRLDAKIVHDLRNFLFGAPGDGGLDLASLNIQRGRDHGLPDYNTMRSAMGLTPVINFSDISSDQDVVAALSGTYANVNDIDLWVGGLAEDAVNGSQLGELFQSIIVKQFTNLRDGDRFWYLNDLNDEERDRVRNSTLAEIIRDNTGIGNELQDNVFQTP